MTTLSTTPPTRRHYVKVPDNFSDLPEEQQDQVAGALVDVLYEKLNADRGSREADQLPALGVAAEVNEAGNG